MNIGIGKSYPVYSGFFLPSIDEVIEMRTELHGHALGNFTGIFYQSSSEYDATQSYGLFFAGGVPMSSGKGGLNSIRACRFFTSITVYALRDIGPSGGYIFWKSGNDYLEAAPSDCVNSIWSNVQSTLIGTTGTAIGTGQSNTTAIINQFGHNNSAAKLCIDYLLRYRYDYKRIDICRCTTGIYLRWWYNGYHYFNFTNGYEIQMSTESMGTQVTRMFSRISKIERPTKLKAEFSYQVTLEGIAVGDISGFTGILLAERVEQYESGVWREVEITRGEHVIRDENAPGYVLSFQVTRKELPGTPAVFQKSQHLFIDDTECDLDEDEIVPINKQVNDIAEMQDRQSDFTSQFKIKKTRAMKALFELSGEVGANTTFPYTKQNCRYVNNGIEMITGGYLILDKGDDQYYAASVYSGNLNFFNSIESLKITDLTLASTDHTWNAVTQAASNAADLDYIYPLCEPSDDAGIAPLPPSTGARVEMYGGWLWPFIKGKAIWDEIFNNPAEKTRLNNLGLPYYEWEVSGDILTDDRFLKCFLPISSVKINKAYTDGYLYSGYRRGYMLIGAASIFGTGGTGTLSLISGTPLFATGHYLVPFTSDVKIVVNTTFVAGAPQLYLYVNGLNTSTFTKTWNDATHAIHEWTRAATAGEDLAVWGDANTYFNIEISIVSIDAPIIVYGGAFVPHIFLPDLSQVEFIKMICNMFGLIPDVTARDKKILFWNYKTLYDNIPNARDWSAYLSEREDETEFKFGDYAQNNYLRYKESKDVIVDNGKGTMLVEDETLSFDKDVVMMPVATCDEVTVLTDVNISRIAFNKYDNKTDIYIQNETIDPRIVFVKQLTGNAKTFGIRPALGAGGAIDTLNPKVACSLEVSFSSLVVNYASLSRMLTMTNLRRCKFNLPVYEVAGLKHYIPIYLSQYKAYFYVNKINNYVPGQLCTIDLIKL